MTRVSTRELVNHFLPIPFTCIFLLVAPFICLLILLPIFFLRFLVGTCLRRILQPKGLGPLLGRQSSFLAVDDPSKSPKWTICVWLVFRGKYDSQKYFQMFADNVIFKRQSASPEKLEYPEFQQYYYKWLGFFFWKDEGIFELSQHMRVYQPPGNSWVDQRELQTVIKTLTWAPFPKEKSPWEILWVDNYRAVEEPEVPRSVMLFRVHHALCDGFQILKMKMDDCAGHSLGQNGKIPNYPPGGLLQKAFGGVRGLFMGPYHLTKMLVQSYDINELLPRDRTLAFPFNNAFSPLVSLARIKAIRDMYDVSFNAVILEAITGGIRRLMLNKGMAVPRDLSAAVPVPLPGHPGKLTNYWTSTFMQLPVGCRYPVPRLKKIQERLQKLKSSFAPHMTHLMMKTFGGLFHGITKAMNNNTMSTLCISNFPGPRERKCYRMGGVDYDVEDMNFAAGNGGGQNAIGFHIMSYGDQLRFVVEGERQMLETDAHAQELNLLILEELDTLEKLGTV